MTIAASDLDLLLGAEPFLFSRGSRLGCLLIHGFTASPAEMRPVGDALADAGFTALAPRLAHHGSDPADMNRSHWRDWYLSALDGLHLLSGLCGQVVVIGLSMGGLAALLLAAHAPTLVAAPIAGVVAMSTPLMLQPEWLARLAGPIARVRPYIPKENWEELAKDGRVSYPVSPTRAVAQIRDYIHFTERALPAVSAPTLLIHDRGDTTAPPESSEIILRRITATDKQLVWLESGVHVITRGPDRETVCAHVTAFVGRLAGASDKQVSRPGED